MAACAADEHFSCDVHPTCLSFVLRHFLPVSQLSVDTDKKEASFISRQSPNIQSKIILTGSSIEGFNVPLVVRTGHGSIEEIVESDVDVMINRVSRPATDDLDDDTAELHIRPSASHPGYVKLEAVRPDSWEPHMMYISSSGKAYLRSSAVVEDMFKRLEDNDPNINAVHVVTGPAVKHSKSCERQKMEKLTMEWDLVIAFPCPDWPQVAEEWVSRSRDSGWPNSKLIKRIVRRGCHIVSVGHEESETRDIEFRWSFSVAEKILAKSLTPTQRQCYILLKILHREAFKRPKVITSYHLKNILFWVCEEIPAEDWKQKRVGECLLALLDKLIETLSEGCLPHYFLEENNLIEYVDSGDLEDILKKVEEVRTAPLGYLFDFNRVYKFNWGPFYRDMADIMRRLLECDQTSETNKYSSIYTNTRDKLALAYIDETIDVENSRDAGDDDIHGDKHDLSVKRFKIAKDIFYESWKCLKETDRSFLQYLLTKANLIENGMIATRFNWFIIQEFDDSDELALVYGQLGCRYHANYYLTKSKTDKKAMKYNAGKAFYEAIQLGADAAVLVDYGNFLCDFSKYEEAIPVLKSVVEDDTEFKFVNGYDEQDVDTVDGNIQEVIKNDGSLTVHSVIYAQYLLVKCHKVSGNENQVKHEMYKFRKLSNAVIDREEPERLQINAKLLLGIAYKNVNRLKPALKAFNKVLEFSPLHLTAQVQAMVLSRDIGEDSD